MTKHEALQYADGSVVKLARILGITHSAISQWEDHLIPRLREYELRDIIEGKAVPAYERKQDATA